MRTRRELGTRGDSKHESGEPRPFTAALIDRRPAPDAVQEGIAPSVPRWLSVVDGLTLLLVVLAACVFVFGGFRETVAGVRLSIRSWQRLAGLAVLLATIRHAYMPRPAMPQVIAARATAFWRSDARRDVWPVFLSTRLMVLLVGYLAVVTFGIPPGIERFRVSHNELENLVARWDVAWYLGIITNGYGWDGNTQRQQSVVFFPAFPTITRAVGLFLGNQWLLAGLLVAFSAFFAALIILYRLARELLDAERARISVWALASYPFAVYYSVPYTEALYLFGSVAAFYGMTRGNWWRAAAFGYFVALCRPNGFLIALPLAILALGQMRRQRRVIAAACAPMMAPLAGLLTYSLFLYVRFGDALAWRKGQLAWGRMYPGLWASASALWTDRYRAIADFGFYHYSATNPYDMMYTAAALFVLASVIPTIRRFGLAYGVFTLVNILPPLLIGGMMSIGRMTSVLFPAFLWLGAVVPPRYLPALIAVGCMLQGLVAALFFDWRPIF